MNMFMAIFYRDLARGFHWLKFLNEKNSGFFFKEMFHVLTEINRNFLPLSVLIRNYYTEMDVFLRW